METVTLEAKLTHKLLEELGNLINEGWYTDRSEAIRDAVRKLIMERRLSKEAPTKPNYSDFLQVVQRTPGIQKKIREQAKLKIEKLFQ